MKIREGQEQVYAAWKAKNQGDPYGVAIFSYAEEWAILMEAALAEGKKLTDVASSLSDKADIVGITGFMYGAAVNVLAHCWEYGEELRRWHNLDTQLHDEGEKANDSGGVLNPALLMME